MDKFLKNLIFGVGIAFGVSLSSFALYTLFKKEEELFLSSNLNLSNSDQISVKMQIPFNSMGFLIGKNGEVVKSIQSKTKTRINFSQRNNFNKIDEESYLIIKGLPRNVKAAESIIKSILEEHSQIVTETFNINTNDIGIIIGKNGSTIRTFCEESGAKIKVKNKQKNQDPFLEIHGTIDQVSYAKQLINKRLAKRKLKKFYESQEIIQETDVKFNALDMFENLTPITDSGCIEVYVSAVCNPNKFWVQLFGTKSIELDRLLDEMTQYYQISRNQKLSQIVDFHVNDIVAVICTRDKHWYRAKIVQLNESSLDDMIIVHYLDFGDECKVFRHEICSLEKIYLSKLKFQAIQCSLNGIKSIEGEEWSEEAIKYFTQATYASQWKQMLAKPIQKYPNSNKSENVYLIDLIDINQEHDIDIGEDLIAKGFAKRLAKT